MSWHDELTESDFEQENVTAAWNELTDDEKREIIIARIQAARNNRIDISGDLYSGGACGSGGCGGCKCRTT